MHTIFYFHLSPFSQSPYLFCLSPTPSFRVTTTLFFGIYVYLFGLFIYFLFIFTYEWNNMVFVFFYLIYITQHNILKVYPCCHKWQDFIHFYDCVLPCVCVCACMYGYMYDSAIPTPGYLLKEYKNTNSKRYMYSYIHHSTIYNSQDMKTT